MRYTFVLVATTCGHHVWRNRIQATRKCLECGSTGLPYFQPNNEEGMTMWMLKALVV